MDIRDLLRKWRKFFDLTQEELGEKAGFHRQTIVYWENNKNIPDVGMLKKIAASLGIDYQDFLEGTETYKKKIEEKRIADLAQSYGTTQIITSRESERTSKIYFLSDLEPTLLRTPVVGYIFNHEFEKYPDQWFEVIIDRNIEPFSFKRIISICRYAEPQPGDWVLVWISGIGVYFIEWKEDTRKEDYPGFFGVILGERM